jgi:hypothetical protein
MPANLMGAHTRAGLLGHRPWRANRLRCVRRPDRAGQRAARRLPRRAAPLVGAIALLASLPFAVQWPGGAAATAATAATTSATSTEATGATGASGVSLAVGAPTEGPPVPGDFVGLSYEVKDLPLVASLVQRGDLVNLLRSLGPGVLRFGGVTADSQVAWLDPANQPLPAWASSSIDPAELYQLGRLARRTGWRVLLTVNLGHYDPSAAADEARVAQAALGSSLEAIEIGNEPQSFVEQGLRAPGYEVLQYSAEVTAYVAAIERSAPGVAIAGPDGASGAGRLAWIQAAATALQPTLLTAHLYGANWCNGFLPTSAYLLSKQIHAPEVRDLRALAALGRSFGAPVRIDETNSISCRGEPGVSDSYAAALWALDLMTRVLQSPFAGVNFHGFLFEPEGYSPIAALTPAALERGALSARPEWYALLMARRVEGDSPLTVQARPSSLNIATWAGRTASGQLQVIVDDERIGAKGPLRVTIAAPRRARAASLLTLTGPTLTATGGVTLGGATVAADGTWHPAGRLPRVPVVNGTITLTMAPRTAVLVSTEAPSGS